LLTEKEKGKEAWRGGLQMAITCSDEGRQRWTKQLKRSEENLKRKRIYV
jgi:hypothetical protein